MCPLCRSKACWPGRHLALSLAPGRGPQTLLSRTCHGSGLGQLRLCSRWAQVLVGGRGEAHLTAEPVRTLDSSLAGSQPFRVLPARGGAASPGWPSCPLTANASPHCIPKPSRASPNLSGFEDPRNLWPESDVRVGSDPSSAKGFKAPI